MRDAPGGSANGKPIITHTYDYATPRDAPARLGLIKVGPWIHREFNDAKIPAEYRITLADFLLDHLAEAILALQTRLPNFHVIDTRNTLKRAVVGSRGNSNDWVNEFHPNLTGYQKLAPLWQAELAKHLP